MAEGKYNVQCISGEHVFTAAPGSDLEQRAKANEASGKIDALIISSDECVSCQQVAEMRDRQCADLLA